MLVLTILEKSCSRLSALLLVHKKLEGRELLIEFLMIPIL